MPRKTSIVQKELRIPSCSVSRKRPAGVGSRKTMVLKPPKERSIQQNNGLEASQEAQKDVHFGDEAFQGAQQPPRETMGKPFRKFIFY